MALHVEDNDAINHECTFKLNEARAIWYLSWIMIQYQLSNQTVYIYVLTINTC